MGDKAQQSQVQLSHDATQQQHAVVAVQQHQQCVQQQAQQQAQQQQQVQQNQQQQQQASIAPASTTITTMSTLHQHPLPPPTPQPPHQQMQQVQVIQQPLQNPTTYLPQLYNTQGQLLMPSNMQLHPGINMNPSSIHVIAAAGKPFQPNTLPPQMITTQKSVLQGQTASFPGYIPTTTNQTLLISHVGVINNPPNILPANSAAAGKPGDMQKVSVCSSTRPTFCYTVARPQVMAGKAVAANGKAGVAQPSSASYVVSQQSQQLVTTQAPTSAMIGGGTQFITPLQYTTCGGGRAVQQGTQQVFPSWQFTPSIPQVWTTPAGIQSSTPLLTAQNPIFIRPQQDGSGIFMQSPPPQIQPHNAPIAAPAQIQPTVQPIAAATAAPPALPAAKPRQASETPQNIQPKSIAVSTGQQVTNSPRPLSNILPSSQAPALRPALSVSTQTAQMNAAQVHTNSKLQSKMRTKPAASRASPAPGVNAQKADAANQTKLQTISPASSAQQTASTETMTVGSTPGGNKTVQNLQQQINLQKQQQQIKQQMQYLQLQHQQLEEQAAANAESQGLVQPPPTPTPMPAAVTDRPVMPVTSLQPCTIASSAQEMPKAEEQGVQATNLMEVDEASQVEDVVPSEKEDQATAMETVESGVEEVREKQPPPKAMVKPQVLTHVIEGYVIQEASEPFEVNRRSDLPVVKDKDLKLDPDEPPKKKHAGDVQAKCETCGKVDLRSKFNKSKRFCSMTCAKSKRKGNYKNANLNNSNGVISPEASSKHKDTKDSQWPKGGGKNAENWSAGATENEVLGDENTDTNDSAVSGPESSLSPSEAAIEEDSSASESLAPKVNPLKWTVPEVCEFIRALPGCSDYVEDFAIQEIDGQALMLLKEDHLMNAMQMKLGPALKICARIDTMRGEVKEKMENDITPPVRNAAN